MLRELVADNAFFPRLVPAEKTTGADETDGTLDLNSPSGSGVRELTPTGKSLDQCFGASKVGNRIIAKQSHVFSIAVYGEDCGCVRRYNLPETQTFGFKCRKTI